jgi:RHS repeat-associated protein
MPGVWGPTARAQAKPSTGGTHNDARKRGAGILTGGKTYALLRDHIGSVRLIVDVQSGTVAQRLGYDEFGRVVEDTNSGFQPFGFAGGLYDADTGFVHFGAREYDPYLGRWISKDPIRFEGGQSNVYAYVDDDPINRRDYLGLNDEEFGNLLKCIGSILFCSLSACDGPHSVATCIPCMTEALAKGCSDPFGPPDPPTAPTPPTCPQGMTRNPQPGWGNPYCVPQDCGASPCQCDETNRH